MEQIKQQPTYVHNFSALVLLPHIATRTILLSMDRMMGAETGAAKSMVPNAAMLLTVRERGSALFVAFVNCIVAVAAPHPCQGRNREEHRSTKGRSEEFRAQRGDATPLHTLVLDRVQGGLSATRLINLVRGRLQSPGGADRAADSQVCVQSSTSQANCT